MLQTKVFVSEFCLRGHLQDVLFGSEYPRQEGIPRCHQLTSQAASAVPCCLRGNNHLWPSLRFVDADLIIEFSLRVNNYLFALD